IRAFALHPGGIVTGLARHISAEQLRSMGSIDAAGEPVIDPDRDMKSIPQGSATQLWCAVSPMLEGRGGVFCANCDIAPLMHPGELTLSPGERKRPAVAPYAVDPASARRLWRLSETMTGVSLA